MACRNAFLVKNALLASFFQSLNVLARVIFSVMMVTMNEFMLKLAGGNFSQIAILKAKNSRGVIYRVNQVVRYHENCQPKLTIDAVKQLVERVSVLNVNSSRRFIENEQFRVVHQCPRDEAGRRKACRDARSEKESCRRV